MIFLWTALATYWSATFYRLGGGSVEAMDKEYPWIPYWIKHIWKKRALLCTLISVLMMWLVILPRLGMTAPWWIHVLAFWAAFGMTTTYHDTYFYNWMNPDDNFWLHGFLIGVAFMFYGIHNPALLMWLGIRALIMGVFMGVWCHIIFGDAFIEENGRGAIIPLTLPLLLLA